METVLLISFFTCLVGFASALAHSKKDDGVVDPPKNWEEFIDNCNSYNRSIGAKEYPKNDKK
jgi:hypothetical protein